MKKKYLFLGLALLLCGGSAWAQTTSKDIASFKELTFTITGINNAANLKTEIAQLELDVKTYENNLKAATQYVTAAEKKSFVHDALLAYYQTINLGAGETILNETELYYAFVSNTVKYEDEDFNEIEKTTNILYITIPSVHEKIKGSDFNTKNKITEWKNVKANQAYQIRHTGNAEQKKGLAFYKDSKRVYPDQMIIVFCAKNTGDITTDIPFDIKNMDNTDRGTMYTPSLLAAIYGRSETLFANNSNYSATEEVIQTDGDGNPIETTDYKNKKKILEDAQNELSEKKATLGDFASITTLNITEDIIVPANNTLATQTWPAGYTIEGNYHTVSGTDTGNNPLFNANNGSIYNWVAVDGRIAKTNSGTVDNCIVKTVEGYRVYTENAYTNVGTDIKDAVYQKRDIFGYDFTTQKVGEVSESNKLYKASYASAANKTKQSFYVNIKGSNITDGNGLTSYPTENAFIYVEDNNVPEITTENVVANGVCKNAKIVDGLKQVGDKKVNTAEFYIPTDFKVENLSYARNLTTDVATVCMPFAFTDDVKDQINKKLSDGNEVYYTA